MKKGPAAFERPCFYGPTDWQGVSRWTVEWQLQKIHACSELVLYKGSSAPPPPTPPPPSLLEISPHLNQHKYNNKVYKQQQKHLQLQGHASVQTCRIFIFKGTEMTRLRRGCYKVICVKVVKVVYMKPWSGNQGKACTVTSLLQACYKVQWTLNYPGHQNTFFKQCIK